MGDALPALLEQYWGYSTFRPHQREAMTAVLESRDSVVVLPTGGGKSLCFQAPALVRDGMALVVSPLISLMKDQVDTLVSNGVSAAYYNSTLSPDEKSAVANGIREGRYKLLYVAPERLVGESSGPFLSLVSSRPVSFVAIDEAHCISQWGHDFRPEYRQLRQLKQRLPSVSLHAFTATATARVRRDIVSELGLTDAMEIVGSFDRPNLVYRVVARATLKKQLLDVIERHRGESGIVYCTSRKDVDALSAWLVESGYRARPYHAGLDDATRHDNQDAFLNEDIDIIVATVAFGMGIDRSDVRFVIHAGAPQSLEHYQQESGRAGRDGLEAECVLVYSAADFLKWRMMLERNGELSDERRALLRDIERYAARVGCRHRHIVGYFGEHYDRDRCGACDYCLGELEPLADSVTLARKVLSAVARVGQRFGTAHVANVLRGSDAEAIRARGHDTLTTFGLLKDATTDEVRGYIDQLLAHGLLQQTDDDFPVLQLTTMGAALLKDAATMPDLSLARLRRPVKGSPSKSARDDGSRPPQRAGVRVGDPGWEGVDRSLFERLRAMRIRLARARGVPPYVIFHDTTLRDLARRKPRSIEELHAVYGMGARKIELLGSAVLETINET
jgi:ATP-dependent DNA helicase RecQ